jgi:hypothetical protein
LKKVQVQQDLIFKQNVTIPALYPIDFWPTSSLQFDIDMLAAVSRKEHKYKSVSIQ